MECDITPFDDGDLCCLMAVDRLALNRRKSRRVITFIIVCPYGSIFRTVLLTGGLLVRIQPEEPNLEFAQ